MNGISFSAGSSVEMALKMIFLLSHNSFRFPYGGEIHQWLFRDRGGTIRGLETFISLACCQFCH